jgi:hypothetical protein
MLLLILIKTNQKVRRKAFYRPEISAFTMETRKIAPVKRVQF